MRPRSTFLSCIALAAALLLLSACSQADAAEVVAAAADKTEDAKTSKMTIRIDVSGAQALAAQQLRITGEGAFDYAGRKGNLTLNIPMTGPTDPASRLDSVIDGTVVYQHLPPELGAQLPGGKSWIKLDLKQLGASNVPQAQSSDPTQAMRFLRGVSG